MNLSVAIIVSAGGAVLDHWALREMPECRVIGADFEGVRHRVLCRGTVVSSVLARRPPARIADLGRRSGVVRGSCALSQEPLT